MYIITDSLGRETLILKKTERAARTAFNKRERENRAQFSSWPLVTIVSIRPATSTPSN